jgi:hypothetical protein
MAMKIKETIAFLDLFMVVRKLIASCNKGQKIRSKNLWPTEHRLSAKDFHEDSWKHFLWEEFAIFWLP